MNFLNISIFVLLLIVFIYTKINTASQTKNIKEHFIQNNDTFKISEKSDDINNFLKFNTKKNKNNINDNINIKNKDFNDFINSNFNFENLKFSNERKNYLFNEINLFFNNYISSKRININYKMALNILNNKIEKITYIRYFISIILLYLILNQDEESITDMYQKIDNNQGNMIILLDSRDYILKYDGSIILNIPFLSESILSSLDRFYIYENMRDNKGIITINKLINFIIFAKNYLILTNNYILDRRIPWSSDSLVEDENVKYYSEIYNNLLKIRKYKNSYNSFFFFISTHHSLVKVTKKDIESFKNNIKINVLKLDVKKDKNYKNYKNNKFFNETKIYNHYNNFSNFKMNYIYDYSLPNRLNTPLKLRCERPWMNSTGPNFLADNNLIS